jgi:hypothetical protein
MSFSVVWMAQCITKLVAFAFSSSTGQWQSISRLLSGLLSLTGLPLFSWRQYAYGCFYWVTDWREKLLVLDARTMEFSIAEPPPEAIGLPGVDVAFVEAGEGRLVPLRMFVCPEYTNCLKYNIRQNNCGSSSQWQFERTVSLDFEYTWSWVQRGGTCSYFSGRKIQIFCWMPRHSNLRGRLFRPPAYRIATHIYSNFPPSLLLRPTISGGKLSAASLVISFPSYILFSHNLSDLMLDSSLM